MWVSDDIPTWLLWLLAYFFGWGHYWLMVVDDLLIPGALCWYAASWYFEAPAGFRGKGWWPFSKQRKRR